MKPAAAKVAVGLHNGTREI